MFLIKNYSIIFDPNTKLTSKFGSVYYVSPEVLRGDYNEKCDLWSIGVILFILLSGRPPFGGNTDQIILQSVHSGKYSFSTPEWENVSDSAKDLIDKLLEYDVDKRISAKDALNHDWILDIGKSEIIGRTNFKSKALDN